MKEYGNQDICIALNCKHCYFLSLWIIPLLLILVRGLSTYGKSSLERILIVPKSSFPLEVQWNQKELVGSQHGGNGNSYSILNSYLTYILIVPYWSWNILFLVKTDFIFLLKTLFIIWTHGPGLHVAKHCTNTEQKDREHRI